MISRSPHADGTVVTFRLKTQKPTSVVGDFNHWDPLLTPMRPGQDNTYELRLLLKPGRYAFRYLEEGGVWFDDDSSDGIEANGHGGSHSILHIH